MGNAQGKRSIIDDLIDGAREALDALDRLVNGDKRRRPVPVPVRVRNDPPQRDRRPRQDFYGN